MEQWQTDLVEIVEAVADEVERFFLEMSEIMVDTISDLTEKITEQVPNIVTQVDEYFEDLAEPMFEAYSELEDMVADVDPGFPYSVEPTAEKNPACIGCNHYHGQVYGGNLLVCAMHPHGCEDENCPDWEKEELGVRNL